MRIHSDKLTYQNIIENVPPGIYPEVTRHGSRKRDHAFEVGLAAEPGSDAHGIKRTYARNTGQYGAEQGFGRAATWVEWGDWMVKLYKIDPDAIIGYYTDAEDFQFQTLKACEWRPKRENAAEHAERWSVELKLEHCRRELRAERISYGELAMLQELAEHIEAGDVELLEAAGVPEHAAA